MSRKKLIFEAGPMLDRKKTGVGYYVENLIKSMQDYYGEQLEISGYYFNFLNRHGNREPSAMPISWERIRLIPGKLLSLCRRLGFQPLYEIFVRKKSDIVLFTNYVALPLLRRSKIALVVYDLSFLDAPQYTQARNLKFLQRFCPPSIRRADIIITISQFTRERIAHHFPDIKARVVVTPIPPSKISDRVPTTSPRLQEIGVQTGKYILYLGTIEPRKNIQNLVKAYALLPEAIRTEYALVLAGGKGWKDEAILDEIARGKSAGLNIVQTGYITDEEKAALYQNSACFILPSHYEGFGMPVLEAMQYSSPVALSDIAVFHEVADDAAIYFDGNNPSDIAAKIATLVQDKELRRKLQKNAAEQLNKFSWHDNATAVFDAIT
jgi:glycosyltransferase involved in cell wall biosynthesis